MTEVRPTEDEAKLVRAVARIFPEMDVKLESMGERLVVSAASSGLRPLSYVKESFRRRCVRSAVARVLRRSAQSGSLTVRLSKQAAYVGQAAILDEDEDPAIGYIQLKIETNKPEDL